MIRDRTSMRETLLHVALARCQDIDRAIELATRMARLVEQGPDTLQGEAVRVIDTVHGPGAPIELTLLPAGDAGMTAAAGAVAEPPTPAAHTVGDLVKPPVPVPALGKDTAEAGEVAKPPMPESLPASLVSTLKVIIAMQAAGEKIRGATVARHRGLTRCTIQKYMWALQERGHLRRDGKGPGTRWTVLLDPDGNAIIEPDKAGRQSGGGARPPSEPSPSDPGGAGEPAAAVQPSPPPPPVLQPAPDSNAVRGTRAQKSDAELIAEAVAAGRVTKCPPGFAHGTELTAYEQQFGSRMPPTDFRYGTGESKKEQQLRTKRGARQKQTNGKRLKKYGA